MKELIVQTMFMMPCVATSRLPASSVPAVARGAGGVHGVVGGAGGDQRVGRQVVHTHYVHGWVPSIELVAADLRRVTGGHPARRLSPACVGTGFV